MLRARLTLVAVTAAVAAILVTVATAYHNVAPLVGAQVERGLSDRADTVLALLAVSAPLPVRPDMTEQLLLPDGTVQPLTPGRAALPVSMADRAVAAAGHGVNANSIVVDGVGYDVLTKARAHGQGAVMVGQNIAEVDRIDSEFLWRTALITAAAVVLVAVSSWLLIGRILRPIRRLAAATARISTTRELSAVLPDPGRGEVAELTRNFHSMLAALRVSRAQQQQLVQDASHELRTPLTSIRGSAELLQRARGRLAPEDETQVLATLVQEAKALDALVGELVDLSADRYATETPTPVALADLVQDCVSRIRRRTGRTVTVTAEAPATVTARPRALTRAIDNLLDNATKFSPADTTVSVTVHGSRVAVRDHGPGIDPRERRAIFARFYRADHTRSTPGSGLGLAIVHDVVTAHGGDVLAANHTAGGAEVGFVLPQARPDGSEPPEKRSVVEL
ncbi:HAMP domain-containing sensor histidine kinase [Nocardia cyriacigeorgica]|uniref:HAMP domain-containing sensor histidine kinase n=1 Tax=Nocardia cyriacigeorgica TaxID=135487 RepID=UPI00189390A4|nr:HAMP domain-containing sensor histidine kinase [Nocardia cyriacigeorgica]MBF6435213.1 HAMP domain-containing histidine kinase [Nocardia cyriacigeorgica]MBF6454721.1 HAMP domain-containing histidine kinase [Nocardia cyriacigeorgica]MBF6480968.1 HAMP domain-containing histidine kinase [Nocardia cyriacigeorgica]MBF6552615.1 HAMP domain-containing histidine kinase [Nocardia cyriacigeorgica]